MFCLVHTAIGGILAGEQMVRAISTTSVISVNNIPSGKQVRRAKEKGLISVFLEAMSHVASKMRRVYRAEIMRNKSGRVSGARVLCGAPVRESASSFEVSHRETTRR